MAIRFVLIAIVLGVAAAALSLGTPTQPGGPLSMA
jgi:hypothetical protein